MAAFRLGPRLPLAVYEPLVGANLLQAHRAARAELLCAYAYLGAKAETQAASTRAWNSRAAAPSAVMMLSLWPEP